MPSQPATYFPCTAGYFPRLWSLVGRTQQKDADGRGAGKIGIISEEAMGGQGRGLCYSTNVILG